MNLILRYFINVPRQDLPVVLNFFIVPLEHFLALAAKNKYGASPLIFLR